MRKTNAGLFGAWFDRSFLGDDMGWKTIIASAAFRRYVLPVAIGGFVTWLVANNHPDFADAVCSVAAGLAIAVGECQ